MAATAQPSFEMWAMLLLTVAAVAGYATGWVAIELTSIGVLVAPLLVFHLTPVVTGDPPLSAADLLSGFSSPAPLAVSALLVVGRAMGVLFTPIAVNVATSLGAEVFPFSRWCLAQAARSAPRSAPGPTFRSCARGIA